MGPPPAAAEDDDDDEVAAATLVGGAKGDPPLLAAAAKAEQSRDGEACGLGSWDAMLDNTSLGNCLKRSMSEIGSPAVRVSATPPPLALPHRVLTGDVSVVVMPATLLLMLLLLFVATVEELSSCLSNAFCAMPESDARLLPTPPLVVVIAIPAGGNREAAVAAACTLLLLPVSVMLGMTVPATLAGGKVWASCCPVAAPPHAAAAADAARTAEFVELMLTLGICCCETTALPLVFSTLAPTTASLMSELVAFSAPPPGCCGCWLSVAGALLSQPP